jgi:RNA polymerase sigma factor (TIGR02999 family)
MTQPSSSDVTLLLQRLTDGDQDALDQLIPLIYDELHRLAAFHLQRERVDHTLQTTGLVHEAYLRLVDQKEAQWKNRGHFFAVASQAMRRVLVDYARRHEAVKRGNAVPKIPLDEALAFSQENTHQVLAIDELLEKLALLDPTESKIVELRFFGGLTVEETAEVMDISPATVKREWSVAKAWLLRELSKHAELAIANSSDPDGNNLGTIRTK